MNEMMVATCSVCRAWYSMDFEEGIDSVHYDMRTGLLCSNDNDDHWTFNIVPRRDNWQDAN